MTKYSFQKIIAVTTGSGLIAYTSHYIYGSYKNSITPSYFELAAKRLGFTGYQKAGSLLISASEQQEALLKQLQMAGYLKPEKLWQDINRLGIQNPEKAFKEIYPVIKKSKADEDDPDKFNAKILRKNLGKGTELTEQDCMDLILYISQHAFGRQAGQTRHELSAQNWMDKYTEEYLTAAKKIGLVDRISPQQTEYDICWIAGASRIGALCRILDYYYILKKGIKIQGDTLMLTGAHEISASIEGITPAILNNLTKAYRENIDIDTIEVSLPANDPSALEEGRQYIIGLAERYNIKLDPFSPFIPCTTKDKCLPGRYHGKLYANYQQDEKAILTETLMTQDLLITYPPPNKSTIIVISTLLEKGQKPDTATTVRTAAEKFVQSILAGNYEDKKEFTLLLQTNNPYVKRQTLSTQREVNKLLKKHGLDKKGYAVKVEGIGYGCKQGVVSIHSELAAFIAEKWETAMEHSADSTPKRSIESLKFQTRDNSTSVPAYPDVSDINLSGDLVTDFFDEYLP